MTTGGPAGRVFDAMVFKAFLEVSSENLNDGEDICIARKIVEECWQMGDEGQSRERNGEMVNRLT